MKVIIRICSRIKSFFFFIFNIIGYILGRFVPKKENLIVLVGTDSQRYNENSRYLFEYLSKQKDLDVYWFTSSKTVNNYVLSLGFKCLYGVFEKFRVMLKAKMVISTGSSHLDYFHIIGGKAIRYCLNHGIGPKASVYSGISVAPILKALKSIHKFDYLNFTSSYTAELVGKLAFKTPYKKIIVLGYPRNDLYFDKEKSETAKKHKAMARQIFSQMDGEAKLILYTPTWRKDGSAKLPILCVKGFDLDEFNSFLRQNNIYMACTIHPNLVFDMDIGKSNIKVIDYLKDHLFDVNALMMEVDILINDYSTTSTDFALLDRPQIFVMPDYEEYKKTDCFIDDYRSILPGVEIFSDKELKREILERLRDPGKYSYLRKRLLDKYYDVSINNSCELHTKFIKSVLGI